MDRNTRIFVLLDKTHVDSTFDRLVRMFNPVTLLTDPCGDKVFQIYDNRMENRLLKSPCMLVFTRVRIVNGTVVFHTGGLRAFHDRSKEIAKRVFLDSRLSNVVCLLCLDKESPETFAQLCPGYRLNIDCVVDGDGKFRYAAARGYPENPEDDLKFMQRTLFPEI